MFKKICSCIVVAGILALTASCAVFRRTDPRKYEGLDRRLDAFTYIEEGKLVAMAVGTEVTRLRDEEAYIPLAVGFANKTAKPLRFDRETFILYDEAGKRYPMAPYAEVNERYMRGNSDYNFTSFFEVWFGKWPAYTRLDSAFFPLRTGRTVQDFVELPSFHYFMEYLYFPHPENGLLGKRFELHASPQGLEEPVFVKFRVD